MIRSDLDSEVVELSRPAAAPWWVVGGGGLLLLCSATDLVGGIDTRFGRVTELLALTFRVAIEAAVLLWAARRPSLPPAFSRTLNVLGWVSVGSAVTYLLVAASEEFGWPVWNETLDSAWYVLSYVLGLLAILGYPRSKLPPEQRVILAADGLVTLIGVGTVLWLTATIPAVAAGTDTDDRALAVTSWIVNLLILMLLNRLVLQGQAIPSRRAFWWFVVGQTAYLVTGVLAQVEQAGYQVDNWGDMSYYLGVVPTVVACVFIRRDPIRPEPVSGGPIWFRTFNPLPLLVPATLGVFLLLAVLRGHPAQVVPYAVVLVITTMILAFRMILSAGEHVRLLQVEANEAVRVQQAKMDSLGRLAGGIAHEFNNLMTTVINNADLGATDTKTSPAAVETFRAIQHAGERAAFLTSQLVHFSGKQFSRRESLDLDRHVRSVEPSLRALLGDATLELELEPAVRVTADPSQISRLLIELIKNSRTALPAGGVVRVAVHSVTLATGLATPFLPVGPGRYVVLSVADNGGGIAPEVLPQIFDPFFSTHPMHQATGLGLASVYGIVAAHHGGIAVESDPASGTRVRVYLPAGAPA